MVRSGLRRPRAVVAPPRPPEKSLAGGHVTSGPPVLRMAGWPGSPARERMPSAATLHRDARLLRESLLQPGRRLEASPRRWRRRCGPRSALPWRRSCPKPKPAPSGSTRRRWTRCGRWRWPVEATVASRRKWRRLSQRAAHGGRGAGGTSKPWTPMPGEPETGLERHVVASLAPGAATHSAATITY